MYLSGKGKNFETHLKHILWIFFLRFKFIWKIYEKFLPIWVFLLLFLLFFHSKFWRSLRESREGCTNIIATHGTLFPKDPFGHPPTPTPSSCPWWTSATTSVASMRIWLSVELAEGCWVSAGCLHLSYGYDSYDKNCLISFSQFQWTESNAWSLGRLLAYIYSKIVSSLSIKIPVGKIWKAIWLEWN